MESKNGTSAPSIRTSDRLRSKTTYYNKGFVYYQSPMRKKVKSKKRTAAAQIAKKILTPWKSFSCNVPTDSNNLRRSTKKRKVSTNLEGYTDTSSSEDDDLMSNNLRRSTKKREVSINLEYYTVTSSSEDDDLMSNNLRRSTKKRKVSTNLEGYTDTSSSEDDDLVSNNLRRSTKKRKVSTNLEGYTDTSSSEDDDLVSNNLRRSTKKRKVSTNLEGYTDTSSSEDDDLVTPGYRRAPGGRLLHHYEESEDEAQDDDNDDDDNEEEEEEGEGDSNGENGNEEEEEDDDEQEGRRYDLRGRSEVCRSSPIKGEKQRERAPHSPRRVLHHGMGLAGPRSGRDERAKVTEPGKPWRRHPTSNPCPASLRPPPPFFSPLPDSACQLSSFSSVRIRPLLLRWCLLRPPPASLSSFPPLKPRSERESKGEEA